MKILKKQAEKIYKPLCCLQIRNVCICLIRTVLLNKKEAVQQVFITVVEFIETTTFSVAVISTSSMSATLITFGTVPFYLSLTAILSSFLRSI